MTEKFKCSRCGASTLGFVVVSGDEELCDVCCHEIDKK